MSINTSVHRVLKRMDTERHNECLPGFFRVLPKKSSLIQTVTLTVCSW